MDEGIPLTDTMIKTAVDTLNDLAKKRRLDEQVMEIMSKQRPSPLAPYRHQLNQLLKMKQEWLLRQRRSSLVVDPRRIDDDGIMSQFAPLYRTVSAIATEPEEHNAHFELIKEIIKESIVVEWPRSVFGVHGCGSDESMEIDQAPLIHRARNVVKCRTSHPTMRIKVYAMAASNAERSHFSPDSAAAPQLVEAFFRCTLTKAVGESWEPRNVQVAGRMILTQREGTAAAKTVTDRSGAIVTSDGKLVASQAAPDNHSYVLLAQFGEQSVRTTSFKYENGVLCATFPEMGVTLNSMVDRRQLATRYAVLCEVGLNIDNTLVVQHTMQSLPFLIAITNDQTEPLLNSIVWSRLLDREHYDGSEPQLGITWRVLRQAVTNFVKSQISQSRAMTRREHLHFQVMLLLPRVARCRSEDEVRAVENELFPRDSGENGHSSGVSKMSPEGFPHPPFDPARLRELKENMKRRLFNEDVDDQVVIEKAEFMTERCVSLLDGRTELRHSPWQFLFKATEMILDVGHKLCPSPAVAEKKSTKTKKQLAAAEEYHTMMSLFNKGVISFSSVSDTVEAFRELGEETHMDEGAMLLRFCDENAGHLNMAYGLETASNGIVRPIMGSVSADTLKDFKQGLSEALMDEFYPAQFPRLVRLAVTPERSMGKNYSTIRKRALFNTYQSLRQVDEKFSLPDDDSTVRVNPLTGAHLEKRLRRDERPPFLELNLGAEHAVNPFETPLSPNRHSPPGSQHHTNGNGHHRHVKEETRDTPSPHAAQRASRTTAVSPFARPNPALMVTTSAPATGSSALTPDIANMFLSMFQQIQQQQIQLQTSQTATPTGSAKRKHSSRKHSPAKNGESSSPEEGYSPSTSAHDPMNDVSSMSLTLTEALLKNTYGSEANSPEYQL